MRGSPAARNRAGGEKLTGERSGEILAQHGARAEAKASGGLLAPWRCSYASCPGLRRSETAWPRWNRGAAMRRVLEEAAARFG